MPPQQTAQQRQQLTAQIAPLLAGAAAAPTITSLLATVGVSPAAATAAFKLAGASSPRLTLLTVGPAERATVASEQIYRAAYLVAAAERVQSRINQGMTLRQAVLAERGNLTAHRSAVANRRQVARLVDQSAASHGSVLGWRARMDDNTSAECARADGRNFNVYARPLIGWPGAVHPNCRCRSVAPFAGAGWVDDTATPANRREAVA